MSETATEPRSNPGQLVSAVPEHNIASQRFRDKLDFLPAARAEEWGGPTKRGIWEPMICSVWQGVGRWTRAESVYAE
jgi:hypothetical protein